MLHWLFLSCGCSLALKKKVWFSYVVGILTFWKTNSWGCGTVGTELFVFLGNEVQFFRIYLILVGRLMRKIIKERRAVTLIFPPKPICLSNFSCLPFIFTYCRWSIGVPNHYFIGICIFIWNCMCSSYIYEYYVFACQIGCKYLFLGWCVPFILFMGSWIYRKYCCIF